MHHPNIIIIKLNSEYNWLGRTTKYQNKGRSSIRRIIPRRYVKKAVLNCKSHCCANKQQRFEWCEIYYSPCHNPTCDAFSLMNQWLVTTPAAILDKAQMWERKAKQYEYNLVPCPALWV